MQTGTPAIPAYYAALPGLGLLASIGIDTVRATSLELTRRLLALVDHHGFRTVASRDPARLAGTVAVDVPDARARCPHAQRPRHRRGLPSWRRHPLAPHVYNTAGEVEAAMTAMAEIVRTKDYVPEPEHQRRDLIHSQLREGHDLFVTCRSLVVGYADFCNSPCVGVPTTLAPSRHKLSGCVVSAHGCDKTDHALQVTDNKVS